MTKLTTYKDTIEFSTAESTVHIGDMGRNYIEIFIAQDIDSHFTAEASITLSRNEMSALASLLFVKYVQGKPLGDSAVDVSAQ